VQFVPNTRVINSKRSDYLSRSFSEGHADRTRYRAENHVVVRLVPDYESNPYTPSWRKCIMTFVLAAVRTYVYYDTVRTVDVRQASVLLAGTFYLRNDDEKKK